MSRRCALAHNDAARAIVHDGLMHGHSVHAIARSVNQHRISQSAVRRYVRRYNYELHRLAMISTGNGLALVNFGLTKPDPHKDHGSLVNIADLNSMLDHLGEVLGVVARRDIASKEARIRADPAAHTAKQGSRGLSKDTVAAIRQQVLGTRD